MRVLVSIRTRLATVAGLLRHFVRTPPTVRLTRGGLPVPHARDGWNAVMQPNGASWRCRASIAVAIPRCGCGPSPRALAAASTPHSLARDIRLTPVLARRASLRVHVSVRAWDTTIRSFPSHLSLIRIWRCRRYPTCRPLGSPSPSRNATRHRLVLH